MKTRKRVQISFDVEKNPAAKSRTKQSFRDQVDINNIIARYKRNGVLPAASRQGFYADVSNCKDYHGSMNQVIAAENAFMALPAKLRDRFRNDPAELLSFLQNVENKKEAIALGLIEKVEEVAPTTVAQEEPKKVVEGAE